MQESRTLTPVRARRLCSSKAPANMANYCNGSSRFVHALNQNVMFKTQIVGVATENLQFGERMGKLYNDAMYMASQKDTDGKVRWNDDGRLIRDENRIAWGLTPQLCSQIQGQHSYYEWKRCDKNPDGPGTVTTPCDIGTTAKGFTGQFSGSQSRVIAEAMAMALWQKRPTSSKQDGTVLRCDMQKQTYGKKESKRRKRNIAFNGHKGPSGIAGKYYVKLITPTTPAEVVVAANGRLVSMVRLPSK